MIPSTITGPQLYIFINGRRFGQCMGANLQSNTPNVAYGGIDRTEYVEMYTVSPRVTGEITYVKIRNDGGLHGMGIVAPYDKLDLEKYITIQIYDRLTNRFVLEVRKAKIVREGIVADARKRVDGTFSFEGLLFNTESVTGRFESIF